MHVCYCVQYRLLIICEAVLWYTWLSTKNRIFLQKLIVAQFIKIFGAIYITKLFLIAFARVRNCAVFFLFKHVLFLDIFFKSSHLRLGRSSDHLLYASRIKCPLNISLHSCYKSCSFFSALLLNRTKLCRLETAQLCKPKYFFSWRDSPLMGLGLLLIHEVCFYRSHTTTHHSR
jgi:hypothetical protein